MSGPSSIEWTDASWNPVRGCVKISPGCKHCYAETFAERWRGVPGHAYERGFDPRFAPDQLDAPLRWRKPRRVFVNSMSDLFLEEFTNEEIASVYGVMAACPQHTFQVLTKRAERVRSLLGLMVTGRATKWGRFTGNPLPDIPWMQEQIFYDDVRRSGISAGTRVSVWPLPNVHLGVSVEDRKHGVPRIEHLRHTPAAVRFLSIEPLLEDIGTIDLTSIGWVIAGCESGPKARPMEDDWVRSVRDQCVAAHVPFFFKQRKEGRRVVSLPMLDGRRWAEFPRSADDPAEGGEGGRGRSLPVPNTSRRPAGNV